MSLVKTREKEPKSNFFSYFYSMKKITITVPDDKAEEVEAFIRQFIQQLNISILKEDEKLKVEEWQRDTVIKDESSEGYISSDEIEKTSFRRKK